jgi:hypothetical protein
MGSEFMVLVGVAENRAQADVWQAFLRMERIPSLVKNRNPLDYLQAIVPFISYDLELWVPRSASGRARRALAPSLKPHSQVPAKPLVKRLALLWFLLGPGQFLILGMLFPVQFVAGAFR